MEKISRQYQTYIGKQKQYQIYLHKQKQGVELPSFEDYLVWVKAWQDSQMKQKKQEAN
jgi:hypothetical protein